jgi:HD-like signal output (HDOD) protein
MPQTINSLFEQIHKLPQIPEVVRDLINQLNNPQVKLDDLSRNIAKEQILTLKVLRLVNSAHFGLSRRIGAIDEAITLLGIDKLKTLIIASGLVASVPENSNINIRQFWRDSFQTATYAKWLAEQARQPSDIAYTAGLLRNLGNVLIAIVAPSEYNEIEQHVKSGSDRQTIEQRRLGFTSIEVSAELCRRWKFADLLTETIAQSANPAQRQQPLPLACHLYLAAMINEHQNARQAEEQAFLERIPSTLLQASGLDDNILSARFNEVIALESNMEALLD